LKEALEELKYTHHERLEKRHKELVKKSPLSQEERGDIGATRVLYWQTAGC